MEVEGDRSSTRVDFVNNVQFSGSSSILSYRDSRIKQSSGSRGAGSCAHIGPPGPLLNMICAPPSGHKWPEGFEVGALALSQQHDKFAVADHVHTFRSPESR
jgi:hypothetical protein